MPITWEPQIKMSTSDVGWKRWSGCFEDSESIIIAISGHGGAINDVHGNEHVVTPKGRDLSHVGFRMDMPR